MFLSLIDARLLEFIFITGKITVSHCIAKAPWRIWDGIASKNEVPATNNLLTSVLQIFIISLNLIIVLTKCKKLNQDFGFAAREGN